MSLTSLWGFVLSSLQMKLFLFFSALIQFVKGGARCESLSLSLSLLFMIKVNKQQLMLPQHDGRLMLNECRRHISGDFYYSGRPTRCMVYSTTLLNNSASELYMLILPAFIHAWCYIRIFPLAKIYNGIFLTMDFFFESLSFGSFYFTVHHQGKNAVKSKGAHSYCH